MINPSVHSNDHSTPVTVLGQPFRDFPPDLYIPPHALEIFLEQFSGPLDLLLYLIKRNNIDILNIPIAQITVQYLEYIQLMHQLHLELAAEYLVMAAVLADTKSKMLLPRPPTLHDSEEDPRAELVRRLQEYEQFKRAAEELEQLPHCQRDFFPVNVWFAQPLSQEPTLPKLELSELVTALQQLLTRAELKLNYQISHEEFSVREKMGVILNLLQNHPRLGFTELIKIEEGSLGIAVTFMAILELLREQLIEVLQPQPYGPICLLPPEAINS